MKNIPRALQIIFVILWVCIGCDATEPRSQNISTPNEEEVGNKAFSPDFPNSPREDYQDVSIAPPADGAEIGNETEPDAGEETGVVDPCLLVDCPASTECVEVTCVDGVCMEEYFSGVPCDDDDPCTQGDLCSDNGICTAGEPVVCEASSECTTAACDPITGTCEETGLNGNPCDDGSACTTEDTCAEGACVGTPLECPPSLELCQGPPECDPETGACTTQWVNGQACDDGDACTTADTCGEGGCQGTSLIDCFYEVAPNGASCEPGVLGWERKMDALESLNSIRALHGLGPTTYDTSLDNAMQESALMMAVNSQLNHTPPETWACWTQEGYAMAETSNLYLHWGYLGDAPIPPHDEMVGWMIDDGVVSLGHRRWLIDPFLSSVSYGAAGAQTITGAWPWAFSSVIRVIGGPPADLSSVPLPKVIAYPMGSYPSAYVKKDWYLSASILVNASNIWANQGVSFSGTSISVVGPNGALPVTDIIHNNNGQGLPNHVQWRVQGLQDNTEYTVTLDNVNTGGDTDSFTYTFTLVP